MDIAKTPLENIIREFVAHRLDVSMDGVDMPEGDAVYFEKILRGVVKIRHPLTARLTIASVKTGIWRGSTAHCALFCAAGF